jgi:hypothetical protein
MVIRMKKKILTVITLGLLLASLASAGFVWRAPLAMGVNSSDGETVNTGAEYSNATIGSPIEGLAIWYVWINTNSTQVIYLAYVSSKIPPPVLTFFGQHYMTGNGTEVFVGNTLTAMEVYNDANRNGVPDVDLSNGTNELLYNFAVNSSQSFVITPVQKTLIGGDVHYTWGLRYNTIDGFLLTENQAAGANVLLDYLASSYDFYVQNNASYLKTSFEIGKILNVTSYSDLNFTLEGLSLSLLYGTSVIASNTYTTVVNGEPYNSTTTQSSAIPTQSGEIRIEDAKAYECVFGQNYTLSRDSGNATYPSKSAAVSDHSVPGGVYRSVEGALSFFENVLSGVFPKISSLLTTVNLDYNFSSFLYRVCYPQWDGYALEHDPTYVAYMTLIAIPEIGPPVMLIIGASIAGSAALIVALLDTRKNRRMLPNKSGIQVPSS